MTKEQLKSYRMLKSELINIKSNIEECKVHIVVQGSKKDFPHNFVHDHIDGIPIEYYNLLIRRHNLESQIRKIDRFVNEIEDDILRKSIKLRYIMIEKDSKGKIKPPLKWYQIAQKIDCGLSGDGIRMKVDRFLKNI